MVFYSKKGLILYYKLIKKSNLYLIIKEQNNSMIYISEIENPVDLLQLSSSRQDINTKYYLT